jgi:hypothetical protein
MAETKDGLEVVYGYLDQTGALGKVYYNSLTGSAGTKNLGVGTAVNTGSSMVYFGSGVAVANGKVVKVAQSTVAIGSAPVANVCYTIEVGSDMTVHATAGGTGAAVSNAVTARAGTTAGHAPLAYVTVGTSGSVLSGSIVDERTFLASTKFSYVTGWNPDITDSPKHIFDGTSYAHSKCGRVVGKFGLKQLFVTDTDPWPTDPGTFMTKSRIAIEADYKGLTGTTELLDLHLDCVKENRSVSHPEEGAVTVDYSGFYGSKLAW